MHFLIFFLILKVAPFPPFSVKFYLKINLCLFNFFRPICFVLLVFVMDLSWGSNNWEMDCPTREGEEGRGKLGVMLEKKHGHEKDLWVNKSTSLTEQKKNSQKRGEA